jgi:hypothetical protein
MWGRVLSAVHDVDVHGVVYGGVASDSDSLVGTSRSRDLDSD